MSKPMIDPICHCLISRGFQVINLDGYRLAFTQDSGPFKRAAALNVLNRFNDKQIFLSFHLTQVERSIGEDPNISKNLVLNPGISILAVTASSEFRVEFLSDVISRDVNIYVDKIERVLDMLPSSLDELRASYQKDKIGSLDASLFYLDDWPAQRLLGI